MRTVLLTDGSPGWIYVANEIHAQFPFSYIVLTGKPNDPITFQRRLQLQVKKLQKRGLVKFADLVAKSFANRLMGWNEKHKVFFFDYLDSKKIEHSNLKFDIPKVHVHNINSAKSVNVIKSLNPDIMITRASAILSEKIFKIPRISTLNVHFGIIPEFRGGGNFNAIRNNNFKDIGVSVHCIDKGIDTGSLIYQERIELDVNENFGSIGAKSLICGTSLLMKTLEYLEKHGTFVVQDTSNRMSRFYWSQHGLSDYLIARRNLAKHTAALERTSLH